MSVLSADFSESNYYTTHPNQSLLPMQAQKSFLEKDSQKADIKTS